MSRFIVLGGPSCVGKGPLYKALKRFYPELGNRLKQLVLYNDRAARPGEEEGVDYFFRPRAEVEELGKSAGHVLAEVRGDLQALEVAQIQRIMDEGFDPFFEGNPFIPGKLREEGVFDKYPTFSVFLSPLSKDEILYLKAPERKVDVEKFITDVQRLKLLHRTKRQKVNLSLKDYENIENRAALALVEMREAWKFDYVIPLHDGEGNDNWDTFYYPIGDARKALEAFAALLRDNTPPGLEKWDIDLIP